MVVCFLVAIGLGAVAFSNWFRYYSIATLAAFAFLAVLKVYLIPLLLPGPDSPTIGLQERTMGFGYFLWVSMLALTVLRRTIG